MAEMSKRGFLIGAGSMIASTFAGQAAAQQAQSSGMDLSKLANQLVSTPVAQWNHETFKDLKKEDIERIAALIKSGREDAVDNAHRKLGEAYRAEMDISRGINALTGKENNLNGRANEALQSRENLKAQGFTFARGSDGVLKQLQQAAQEAAAAKEVQQAKLEEIKQQHDADPEIKDYIAKARATGDIVGAEREIRKDTIARYRDAENAVLDAADAKAAQKPQPAPGMSPNP